MQNHLVENEEQKQAIYRNIFQTTNTNVWNSDNEETYFRPVTPSTTKLSAVRVPVLSKQHISIFPAKGILNGSVQYTSGKQAICQTNKSRP